MYSTWPKWKWPENQALMHGFLRTKSMNLPVFLLEWLSQQQPFTTWFSCDARRCYKGKYRVSGVWGVARGPDGTGGRVR
jgi:hypothetical protein